MSKLLLCCGPTRPAGFVRLDSNPAHQPDILAEIPPLPPEVLATKWDVVELIHGIEHFWPWDAGPLLKEIHEVLRPGGVLVLEQPDAEVAARALLGLEQMPGAPRTTGPATLTGADNSEGMWSLYGDPNHRDPGYMHRWAYRPASLTALLRASAPWSSVKVLPQQYHAYARGRDFRVEATR